jgi:hypothetical protein
MVTANLRTKTSSQPKKFDRRTVLASFDRVTEARIKSQFLTFPFAF